MKAIINTNIILPDSMILDGVVTIKDGRIIGFGEKRDMALPEGTQIIDAQGLYTAPGFVDIHCHGGGGHWFYDEPEQTAGFFLKHGHTTMLAALFYSLTMDEHLRAVETIGKAKSKGAARAIQGLYMEGPYLNPKYGCDERNNKWKGPIDAADCEKLIGAAGEMAYVWCIAPEREGIETFVKMAARKGLIFSVAHSEATPEQVYRYIPYGLKLQTHHTNATGHADKSMGIRSAGVDEATLLCDDMFAELICDSGAIHVNPYMLRLALKNKGRERIILVSDSTSYDFGVQDSRIAAPDLCYDSNGKLAGSKLTLPMACRNMMKHTGSGLCDVVRFATYNPARLLGLENEIGCIRPGARANLVIMDDMLNIEKVFFMGEEYRA